MAARKPRAAAPKADPGSTYNLSGDFRGATVNIQSTIVGAEQVRELEDLPPEPGEPPYLGLSAFSEKDSTRFFGREALTARLAARLAGTNFLAVIGDSGSGKSSLVRAGLVPALRRGETLEGGLQPPPNASAWEIRVLTPTAHPLQSLAAVLAREDEPLSALASLESDLNAQPEALGLAARRLLVRTGAPRLLLVIDQFEELFSQCRQEEERAAFVAALCRALDTDQPLTVLIVLRADFYARLAHFDRLRDLTAQNQEFIGAMTRDELFRAVVTPAALGNWKIQEGLVEVMLDDAGGEPGALPLLSHALLETWRRRRGRTLTLSAYTESGGVRGAIARTAEAVFTQRLNETQRPVARLIFTRLVELDEDALDTRRRASFSELITRSSDPATIQLVLGILSEARLVTLGAAKPAAEPAQGGEETVEVAHEALIREWPTLRGWLAEDREGLLVRQRLSDDARDWLRLNKDPGELYRGLRLNQVLEWSQNNPGLLSLDEQAFLEASRQAQAEADEKERAYRRSALTRRLVIPGLAAVFLGVLVLLFFATGLNNRLKTPAKMGGLFNIAVAEFGKINTDGSIESWNGGYTVAKLVTTTLEKGPGGEPDVLVWQDGVLLQEKNVKIGRVEGNDAAARQTAAGQMAQRLNAQMIVYGNLDTRTVPPRLMLEFWLAPQADYRYEDMQGTFQSDQPILVADPENPGMEVAQELERQSNVLAWTAIGLARMRFGQAASALESFRSAEEQAPDLDTLQFFIGRASLFLSDLEPGRQETLLREAEAAFKKAIDLNPAYVTAYKALASTYAGQAQRLLKAVQDGSGGQAELEEAARWAGQALELYRKAAAMPPGPRDEGLFVNETSRLGEGIALRIRAEIEYRAGDSAAARASLDEAQPVLEALKSEFAAANQERSLIQTRQALGTLWQWRGFLAETSGDSSAAVAAYQAALSEYDGCLKIGAESLDRIVREDVAEKLCRPFYGQVKQKLEELAGGGSG